MSSLVFLLATGSFCIPRAWVFGSLSSVLQPRDQFQN